MANASDFSPSNEDLVINDFFNFAASEIYKTYGDKVTINRKSIHKFGRYQSLGAVEAPINFWGGGPLLSTSNSITHFSSTDAADTQTLYVEGMTISNGLLTFKAQTITLDGVNKTALPTPLARCTRIANTASATATAGDVYIYEDDTVTAGVPDTSTKIANVMPAISQSSLLAGTSIVNNNYFLITGIFADVNKKTTATVDMHFRTARVGKVLRDVTVGATSTGFSLYREATPFYIIPPNSDIQVYGASSAAGTDVTAGFNGFLADIV